VNRVRAGDFARVYDEHVWDVYGFFGYRVRSREEAEDFTQLTSERALRAWKRFDPDRVSSRTWLLAIAHNLLVDQHRRDESGRRETGPAV
jgi:RNA polymerase sigma-70 factor (ECF subfamily)